MQKIEVKKTINAAPEKVWATLAKGSGVNDWFPIITTCRVEGNKRYCTMAGGGDLDETIISADHQTRTFTYSVDKHPLPWGPVHSTVKVNDAGMGKSEIIWQAEFDGSAEAIKQAMAMLPGLYGQGIDALEAYHKMAV
jgi:uncharacterized protein YndB with AHSA1/START domain